MAKETSGKDKSVELISGKMSDSTNQHSGPHALVTDVKGGGTSVDRPTEHKHLLPPSGMSTSSVNPCWSFGMISSSGEVLGDREESEDVPMIFTITRRVYTSAQFEEVYKLPPETRSRKCRCSASCLLAAVLSCLPVIKVLRQYNKRDAYADFLAGLSVGFLHLPQGLGYAILASLEPVHGLYSSFFPMLVYSILGTSPHVSMGTNAVMGLLAGSVINGQVEALGANSTILLSPEELLSYKVSVSSAACCVSGLVLVAMWALRLGFLTNFMAKSFIGGFSYAAAIHITINQIPKLLNLKVRAYSGLGKLVYLASDMASKVHTANVPDVVVGLLAATTMVCVKVINRKYAARLKAPIPIELLVVVLSTALSYLTSFKQAFGIAIVGSIPQGLPTPVLPPLSMFPVLAKDSATTALLIFALTISMGKLTAKLHDIDLDDNQELLAYGMVQLVGAFFQNFFTCISPPRTMMLSSLGAKTPLNNLTSALFILLVLLVIGRLFEPLPVAVLGAMIIVSMKDILFQVMELKRLWHINKSDFFIWVLTALSSIFGDLDFGLLVGVVCSMVTVLAVSHTSQGTLFGRSDTEDLITELAREGVSHIPGVRIFRFQSQLHFASAERFKSEMYKKIFDPTALSHKDRFEIEVEVPRKSRATHISENVSTQQSSRDTPDGKVMLQYEMGNLCWQEEVEVSPPSNKTRRPVVAQRLPYLSRSFGSRPASDANLNAAAADDGDERPRGTDACNNAATTGCSAAGGDAAKVADVVWTSTAVSSLSIGDLADAAVDNDDVTQGGAVQVAEVRAPETMATGVVPTCGYGSVVGSPQDGPRRGIGCVSRRVRFAKVRPESKVRQRVVGACNSRGMRSAPHSERHERSRTSEETRANISTCVSNPAGSTLAELQNIAKTDCNDVSCDVTKCKYCKYPYDFGPVRNCGTDDARLSHTLVVQNMVASPCAKAEQDVGQNNKWVHRHGQVSRVLQAEGSSPEGSKRRTAAERDASNNSDTRPKSANGGKASATTSTAITTPNTPRNVSMAPLPDIAADGRRFSLASGHYRLPVDKWEPFFSSCRQAILARMHESCAQVRYVIIDCSTMTYIDTSGVDMLHVIITQFSRAGVDILLARIPAAAMRILTRARFFEHEANQRVFFSVEDALFSVETGSQRYR